MIDVSISFIDALINGVISTTGCQRLNKDVAFRTLIGMNISEPFMSYTQIQLAMKLL